MKSNPEPAFCKHSLPNRMIKFVVELVMVVCEELNLRGRSRFVDKIRQLLLARRFLGYLILSGWILSKLCGFHER